MLIKRKKEKIILKNDLVTYNAAKAEEENFHLAPKCRPEIVLSHCARKTWKCVHPPANSFVLSSSILNHSPRPILPLILLCNFLHMDLSDIARKLELSDSENLIRKAGELRRLSDLHLNSSVIGVVGFNLLLIRSMRDRFWSILHLVWVLVVVCGY